MVIPGCGLRAIPVYEVTQDLRSFQEPRRTRGFHGRARTASGTESGRPVADPVGNDDHDDGNQDMLANDLPGPLAL